MNNMRIGFKNKLKKIRLSPSKEQTKSSEPSDNPKSPKTQTQIEKKQKKENYKQKMMRRYKLDDKQFDEARKTAQKQLKDWDEYKKDQVLKIFESKSSYVSKSAKSDVKHPKVAREYKVTNKSGKTIDVEFGRMKEWYLYSLAPSKQFVEIRTQVVHEQALNPLREKQKKKFAETDKTKQADKKQTMAEYDQLKSIHGTAGEVRKEEDQSMQVSQEKSEELSERNDVNCTDEKRALFPDSWFALSMSRSQMAKSGLTYWMPTGQEEEIDDDPDNKYTVTAEKLIEAIEGGGKVKDSGIVEPGKGTKKTIMTEELADVQARYKKNCGRDVVYNNTLKGTIEFSGKGEKHPSSAGIQADASTDPANQITFAAKLTAFVFKGKRMKRQYERQNIVGKFEEERKDFTREEDESAGA